MKLGDTERTTLLICSWCGPFTVIIAFAGWLVAGVLPVPLGPDYAADAVAAFYAGGVHVPLGIAVASVGISLVIPLNTGIAYLMWRSEYVSPLFTLVQIICGTVTAVCLLFPMLIMAVAGFRPERDPALTVMLNDLAWLLFITPIGPFIIQNITIAVVALSGERPLFPRWLGFLNLWIGFSFSFDILAFAFKSGPFAWNGFLIFWLALTTYSIWLFAMGLNMRHLVLHAATPGADKVST